MERIINIVDYHQRKNNNQTLFDKHASPNLPRCNLPWQDLVVNQHGITYNCASPAWLPKSIGSILDYDNIFDLLNSYEGRAVRSEIDRGRYSYCNSNICQHLSIEKHKSLYNHTPVSQDDLELLDEDQFTESSLITELPPNICFDFDYTCNFKCPSCRTDMINHNQGLTAKKNLLLVEKIKHVILDPYIENNIPLTIRWAGGEPFVSHAYLELWKYIIEKKATNIKNSIQTNGSYLKRRSDILDSFLPFISQLRISFDAASEETYNKIRVNGDWDTLIDNCRYIRQLIDLKNNKIKLTSDFVVQLDNYKEIPEYIALTKQLGFDLIGVSRMWNWDTWSMEEFTQRNVSDSSHPLHNELLDMLHNYIGDRQLQQSFIRLGNNNG